MKPFNLDKFRRGVTKSLGIVDGYHDPKIWISTGNHAINKLISGSFYRGIPLGKVSVLAGESGSGKSYLTVGCVVKEALKQNILCVILDSEFAIDAGWLENAGIDPENPNIIRYPVSLVDECATMVDTFMNQYVEQFGAVPYEERQQVLFVIDSLGMLSTTTEVAQFKAGDMKGDLGRKAKQLKAFVTQCLKMFGPHPVGLVATNHVYASQNQYSPDDVISGGSGFIFASSIIVAMNKLKLKLDENGDKITEVRGIRSKVKVVKSRFSKPFEEIEVQIPYDKGMSPYSGLFDYLYAKGTLKKNSNNTYSYFCKDGTELKMFKKEWNTTPAGEAAFDKLMMDSDMDSDEVPMGVGLDLEEVDDDAVSA